MIPRIKTGASFKGAELYYFHDKLRPGEKERLTTERVAWAHTLNTLSDDPQLALSEMRTTCFNQDILKQLSGNRLDGRPTGKPVMTVSLAWSPEQSPAKEQMIGAATDYLAAMGWQEHQCVLVAHNDTKHPHVHLILNKVHPDTGMTLDDSFSQRRAQKWALAYEREHGHIYCTAREEKYEHGRRVEGQHLNRWEWQTWQEISREQKHDRDFRQELQAGEWQSLKEGQKQERLAFWKETAQMRKELRAALRADVANEFKPEWRAYAQERAWRDQQLQLTDPASRRALRQLNKARLAERRRDITARQKARIAELATPAFERLGRDRAEAYDGVKAQHCEERRELHHDQAQGTRRYDVLPGPAPANQNTGPCAATITVREQRQSG